MAFAPDGRTAFIYDGAGNFLWWDTEHGKLRHRSTCGRDWGPTCAVFSLSGRYLLTGCPGGLRLWEVITAKRAQTIPMLWGTPVALAFCPDGRHALSADERGRLFLWDLGQGKLCRVLEGSGAYRNSSAVAISSDGKWAAGILDHGTTLTLWDLSSGEEFRTLTGQATPGESFTKVAFSPDGKQLLACAYSGQLSLWEAASGRLLAQFTPPVGLAVSCLAFWSGGRGVLVGTAPGCAVSPGLPLGSLSEWELPKGRHCAILAGRGLASVRGSRRVEVMGRPQRPRSEELHRPAAGGNVPRHAGGCSRRSSRPAPPG